MNNLLIFILSAWGLTHLIVSGKIFDRIRNWVIIKSVFFGNLISCYQCTGFWSGVLISLYWTQDPFHILLMSFISSGASSFINSLYVWLNVSIKKMQNS